MRVVRRLQPLINVVDVALSILDESLPTINADENLLQLSRSRTMATVTDDPLSRKVEMTNWEQVGYQQLHIGSFQSLLVERLI